jgi:DNA gyrase/topoisomerase IV subunit A
MIHPDDVAAWIAQVRQQPEAAPGLIEALAARLVALDRQNEALRDELLRLRRNQESATEKGRTATLARRVQALERQLAQSGQPTQALRSLLLLTLDGRGVRLPWPDAEKERDELTSAHLRPRYLLPVSEGDQLLLFSDKGRVFRLNAASVEQDDAPARYLSLVPDLTLDLDESVSAVVSIAPALAYNQMTLVTRKGYARSFRRAEVDSLLERNLPLHSSPVEGDYVAFVLVSDGQNELFIVSRQGKGVRFPERVVGVQPTPAIKLERGDVVAGAVVVEKEKPRKRSEEVVALVGANGVAARRQLAGFSAHPNAGIRGKIVSRIAGLVAVALVKEEDVLWLLTSAGKLLALPAGRLPSGPGASGGKAVVKLGKDERVVGLVVSQVPGT